MNRFLLTSQNANGTTDIFSSDGTVTGTVNLDMSRFNFGFTPDTLSDGVQFDGKLFFVGGGGPENSAGTGSTESLIYGTDGTAAGTTGTQVMGVGGALSPGDLTVLNGRLLTSGHVQHGQGGIWSSTDGSTFTEIETGFSTDDLTVSHGVGFFGSDNQGDGIQGLWRTDGTTSGTHSITPAGLTLNPSNFLSVANGRTVFLNQASNGTYALWSTDGTAAGTQQIIDFALGTNVLAAYGGASTGTHAIFSAVDDSGNISTWSTDGTGAGTTELLVNGPADAAIRTPNSYQTLGSKVIFDNGYALYATDGTGTGTVRLTNGSEPSDETVGGNQVFFTLGGVQGSPLFVSDGTVAGTHQVEVGDLGALAPGAGLTAVGSSVVFEGTNGHGEPTLFTTDGTMAGTTEVGVPAGVNLSLNDPPSIAALPSSDTSSGVVTLGGGNQSYDAPAGTTVQEGSGSDTITATAGQVTVLGSAGRLVFFGGTGASSISGSTGSSTIFGGAGGGSFTAGMAGHSILISQGASGANTTLTGGGAGDQIFGSASGTDILSLASGSGTVVGGGGPTSISGGSAPSVIFGGAGSTSVTAGTGGGDTIVGTSGSLSVTAQAGAAVFGGTATMAVTGSLRGADSIIGGAGTLDVSGRGGNMLVVGSTTKSSIFTGDGASLIFTGAGSTSVTGGAGGMQVVLESGGGTFLEGSGTALYDVIRGAASGTDVISGFKVNTDTINLFGYGTTGYTLATSGGSTTINVADGTKIELLGVTNVGHSIIG